MYFWIGISFVLILWGLGKDKSKVAFAGILAFLFITMAFNRGTYDYNNYVIHFYEFSRNLNLRVEPLFRLIFKGGAIIFKNYDTFKIFLTAVQLCIIYYFIRLHTNSVALVFALYLLYPAYLDGFHTRFFMGSVIVLAAILFYIKKYEKTDKRLKWSLIYIGLIIVAFLIHNSLGVFLFVPLIFLLHSRTSISHLRLIIYTMVFFVILLVLRYSGLLYSTLSSYLAESRLELYTMESHLNSNQRNIIILYFLKQIIRLLYSMFLLRQYKGFYNKKVLSSSEIEDDDNYKYLEFLFSMNCFSFIIVVFQTYSINFERLYRVVDMLCYLGAAVAISIGEKNSIYNYKIKGAALAYSVIFALMYYLQSDYYRTVYTAVFKYNVLFN